MTTSERLRKHMAIAIADDPSVEALVEEACRIIDRLSEIDDIVTGKTEWIRLMHFRTNTQDQQSITVTLDGVLSEARQQAGALKAIFAQLGLGKANLAAKKESRDPLDEIAARRTARGGSTARSGRAAGGAS